MCGGQTLVQLVGRRFASAVNNEALGRAWDELTTGLRIHEFCHRDELSDLLQLRTFAQLALQFRHGQQERSILPVSRTTTGASACLTCAENNDDLPGLFDSRGVGLFH